MPRCELRMASTSTRSEVAPQKARTHRGLVLIAGSHKVQLLMKPCAIWNWVWQGLSESSGWSEWSSPNQFRFIFCHGHGGTLTHERWHQAACCTGEGPHTGKMTTIFQPTLHSHTPQSAPICLQGPLSHCPSTGAHGESL